MTSVPIQDPDVRGLTAADAAARLARDGPNLLPATDRKNTWSLLVEVVREPMFLLLVACGGIYLALGDREEALMLLGFVVVVIVITWLQKRRSENALAALRDLSSQRALVVRDGVAVRIPGRDVVVGDVVLLAEGERVPADLLLVQTSTLTIDESMLTGESVPVEKFAAGEMGADTASGTAADTAASADARNAAGTAVPMVAQAWSGTLVTQGTGRGIVQATGVRSALGRIGASLQAITDAQTPVQRETAHIVTRVAVAGLILAAALAATWGIARGDWLSGLLAGLTLAMAILPEELPVVLTIFLGLGAWRLAKERVLVRNMPAVELLGATTVLCVDKTGTLTMNRMALASLWIEGASGESGADGANAALALAPPSTAAGSPPTLPENLHAPLEYATLASHRRAFDPMEMAINAAAQSRLAGTEHLHADWRLVEDYPLSRELLAMSRVWQSPDQRALLVAAKGAPEAIVDLCHLDPERRAAIAAAVAALAVQGQRVLGVARAVAPADGLPAGQHDFDFEFAGLIGLADPVRPDVPAALAECRAAGMRVVMITGDHPDTALAIAAQAGLDVAGGVLSGAEVEALDDAALAARLAGVNVFCRVLPHQKLRLVQALQAQGEVVAMTGDGVNDAPALKAAHIGVAMGARGTDVAREAADLILLDDAFATLVTAVRHGRRVFTNLRKAIVFVLAVHLPIIGLSLVPVLLGWPMLLMPVHILFLELIIDPACSVVFEAEREEAGTMRQPPRAPDAHLFDREVLVRGFLQGIGLMAIVLVGYVLARTATGSDGVARALAFMVLVLASLALIQANRAWGVSGERRALRQNPAFAWIAGATCAMLVLVLLVPPLARVFAFVTPPAYLLALAAGLVLLALGWFEGIKRYFARTPAPR